jgi:hypothetical protein
MVLANILFHWMFFYEARFGVLCTQLKPGKKMALVFIGMMLTKALAVDSSFSRHEIAKEWFDHLTLAQ